MHGTKVKTLSYATFNPRDLSSMITYVIPLLKEIIFCIADLFLLSHWSIILLSFKLFGGPTSSQKIFTRTVSQLGSKSWKTKGQHIRLYYFPPDNTISTQLVYQHSVTCNWRTIEAILVGDICRSGPSFLHWCDLSCGAELKLDIFYPSFNVIIFFLLISSWFELTWYWLLKSK